MPALSPSLSIDLEWLDHGENRRAAWRTELHGPPPRRLLPADDTLRADAAFAQISQGTALVWQGDFHNARQMLKALDTRIQRRRKRAAPSLPATPLERFHQHRLAQAQRARMLNRLLIPVHADLSIPLRRAPDVADACRAAFTPLDTTELIPLRALQGYVGAWEWQKKGVPVPGLPGRIHVPHGVYSPVRGEYLDLLRQAPLPSDARLAFDVGTGSGVLAALLLQRGVPNVIGTDINPRALTAAQHNLARLGLAHRARLLACDLFPPGKADLIVCNPPWLPAKPTRLIEQAIYDPDHHMLKGFLAGVCDHLNPGGQAWLVMSDLAEHLGLRDPAWLPQAIAQAGLRVQHRLDTRPGHGKAYDPSDPLHDARSRETTSLWCLVPRDPT